MLPPKAIIVNLIKLSCVLSFVIVVLTIGALKVQGQGGGGSGSGGGGGNVANDANTDSSTDHIWEQYERSSAGACCRNTGSPQDPYPGSDARIEGQPGRPTQPGIVKGSDFKNSLTGLWKQAGLDGAPIPMSQLNFPVNAKYLENVYNDAPPTTGRLPTDVDLHIEATATAAKLAAFMSDPSRVAPAAAAALQSQSTATGNAAGEAARDQSASAIGFCAQYMNNFTAGPGPWTMVRDQIFVPMAILLLLPGALLAQMRAIIAAGSPVLGEVNPFEGIMRSIVAIFLIPGSALVVNYGIDLSNSITYTINSEYFRLFGSDMYKDAICAEIRATPVRAPESNRNAYDLPTAPMKKGLLGAQGPFSAFEARTMENSVEDPCVGINEAPANLADEALPAGAVASRLMMNGSNAWLASAWNILCAFQLAYLYYLWCVGPIMAALWVYPLGTLRNALPSWVEGVVTLCFWSLFWNTVILLMACFKGVDETGTVLMTALNFLATASVKYAFDFAGLVKAAGQEAAGMAMGAAKKAAQASGGGAGNGRSAGASGGAAATGARRSGHGVGAAHANLSGARGDRAARAGGSSREGSAGSSGGPLVASSDRGNGGNGSGNESSGLPTRRAALEGMVAASFRPNSGLSPVHERYATTLPPGAAGTMHAGGSAAGATTHGGAGAGATTHGGSGAGGTHGGSAAGATTHGGSGAGGLMHHPYGDGGRHGGSGFGGTTHGAGPAGWTLANAADINMGIPGSTKSQAEHVHGNSSNAHGNSGSSADRPSAGNITHASQTVQGDINNTMSQEHSINNASQLAGVKGVSVGDGPITKDNQTNDLMDLMGIEELSGSGYGVPTLPESDEQLGVGGDFAGPPPLANPDDSMQFTSLTNTDQDLFNTSIMSGPQTSGSQFTSINETSLAGSPLTANSNIGSDFAMVANVGIETVGGIVVPANGNPTFNGDPTNQFGTQGITGNPGQGMLVTNPDLAQFSNGAAIFSSAASDGSVGPLPSTSAFSANGGQIDPTGVGTINPGATGSQTSISDYPTGYYNSSSTIFTDGSTAQNSWTQGPAPGVDSTYNNTNSNQTFQIDNDTTMPMMPASAAVQVQYGNDGGVFTPSTVDNNSGVTFDRPAEGVQFEPAHNLPTFETQGNSQQICQAPSSADNLYTSMGGPTHSDTSNYSGVTFASADIDSYVVANTLGGNNSVQVDAGTNNYGGQSYSQIDNGSYQTHSYAATTNVEGGGSIFNPTANNAPVAANSWTAISDYSPSVQNSPTYQNVEGSSSQQQTTYTANSLQGDSHAMSAGTAGYATYGTAADANWQSSFSMPPTTYQDFVHNNNEHSHQEVVSTGGGPNEVLNSWFAPAPEAAPNHTPVPASAQEHNPWLLGHSDIAMPIVGKYVSASAAPQSPPAPARVAYDPPRSLPISTVRAPGRLTASITGAAGGQHNPPARSNGAISASASGASNSGHSSGSTPAHTTGSAPAEYARYQPQAVNGDEPPPILESMPDSLQTALMLGNQRGGRMQKADAEDEAAMKARLDEMTRANGGTLV